MPDNGPALRDIHVPQVSMWWPLAPGWWFLLALLAALAVGLVIFLRRRGAWRRHVEATLSSLREAVARHAVDGDTLAFAAAASELVRRVARSRDAGSVTKSGQAWRDALAAMAPKRDVDALVALDAAKFRRRVDLDVAATARDVEAWVRVAMKPRTIVNGRLGRRAHVAA
ncbi:hypothetical protein QFZ41_001490 [Luteibacter sp. W1I16]|jgi:hypothetical protein|uniref:DUF4381 domain-containing protein n=1 Tax=Luteibacter sp. W1I16 TaxID=3373922 RepID=UPI003D219048